MTEFPTPTADDLMTIAAQVWSSYLDPEGVNPLVPVAPRQPADEVSAAVSVTGAWRGHVVISFSSAASRHAAAALLGVEFDDVSTADITDAVGELANIIGGNVKSLLPEPSALSLPHVLLGGGHGNMHWPSVTEVCQLSGVWLDEPVTVSVLESTADYVGVKSA
jgi:chemotaxis protein CheX